MEALDGYYYSVLQRPDVDVSLSGIRAESEEGGCCRFGGDGWGGSCVFGRVNVWTWFLIWLLKTFRNLINI